MNYPEKLESNQQYYPFSRWRTAGLEPYTEANCDRAQAIAENLLQQLLALGEQVPPSEKIECFKQAIEAYNTLHEELGRALITAQESVELFELINKITESIGLDPQDYGYGEGLASEWCDW